MNVKFIRTEKAGGMVYDPYGGESFYMPAEYAIYLDGTKIGQLDGGVLYPGYETRGFNTWTAYIGDDGELCSARYFVDIKNMVRDCIKRGGHMAGAETQKELYSAMKTAGAFISGVGRNAANLPVGVEAEILAAYQALARAITLARQAWPAQTSYVDDEWKGKKLVYNHTLVDKT
jgi:hypothetical protein